MFQIREGHNAALVAAKRKTFEDRMVEHIRKHFPQHYEAIGEDDTHLLVQYGIERARDYDIITERDVCKYIDLMLIHGSDFDNDADLPWAREILMQTRLRPRNKIDQLFAVTISENN